MPEVGEYAVGAYLKIIKTCDVIDYNAHFPGGGLKGLGELDVIGLDFKTQTAYLCEVTTHLDGLFYGQNAATTVQKIKDKYVRQQAYAKEILSSFANHTFMFWSPKVTNSVLNELKDISGLDLVINEKYRDCINQLRDRSKKTTSDMNNPFFRTLQILEHLK